MNTIILIGLSFLAGAGIFGTIILWHEVDYWKKMYDDLCANLDDDHDDDDGFTWSHLYPSVPHKSPTGRN